MKQRRRLIIVFGCLSIVIYIVSALGLSKLGVGGDETQITEFTKYQPSGKALKVTELEPEQRIEVTRIRNSHQMLGVYTFIFSGREPGQLLAVSRRPEYKDNWGVIPGERIDLVLCDITAEQKRSLDAFLRFLRNKQERFGPYYDTYEVDYYVGDKKIGSEKTVDWMLGLVMLMGDPAYDKLPRQLAELIRFEDWSELQTAWSLLANIEEQSRAKHRL